MERLEGRGHQARALEWAVVLLFILILGWVLLSRYEGLKEQALATMARYEHHSLETHLQVYRMRHGSWPPDLRTLIEESSRPISLKSGNARRRRLFDDQGRMLDPYGRPYRYDPETGKLKRPEPLRNTDGSG
ncbi:type II secretion system protein GspG [Thiohalorhabdus sp.]|uniref:type II secretion system protein GspG n=1 Tax=Thiohalorhabdus sp. TaxID=3094134 RepID=UPI002FC2D4DC